MSEEYICYQCGGFGCHHCNYLPHDKTGEKHEQDLQKLAVSQHRRSSTNASSDVGGAGESCKRST